MKWFKCCHCEHMLPAVCFHKDKSKKTGRRPRCIVCDRLSMNVEARRDYERRYKKDNPQWGKESRKRWYKENIEHFKEVQDKYRSTEQFKENHRRHGAERRARINNSFVEAIDYKSVYDEYDGLCFYCSKEVTLSECHFDHFIPISKGGNHERSNIRLSCPSCNLSKGAKMPWEVGY